MYFLIIGIIVILILIITKAIPQKTNFTKLIIPHTQIPKFIHQTWKTKDFNKLSNQFKENVMSWIGLGYGYRLYDDHDCLDFVTTHYPQYTNLYKKLEIVEKADVFRYLIIHKYGGIYADMDTLCVKDISPLLNNKLIVGVEYEPQHNNNKTQYLQWFFASVPNNDIFIKIVDSIQERKHIIDSFGTFIPLILDGRHNTTMDKTLWLSGPFVFSEYIEHFSKTNPQDITIYPRCTLGSFDRSPPCKEKSYLIHGFKGSWKKGPYKTNERY